MKSRKVALIGAGAVRKMLISVTGDPLHGIGQGTFRFLSYAPSSRRLALALLLLGLACDRSPTGVPNVVILVVDTLRADHMSVYGYPRSTTPEVDEFSAGAVGFEQAMSVTSWTTPSISALLTSRYPAEVSPGYPPAALPRHVLRLPQLFQRQGYVTGAIVSHFFLGRTLGFRSRPPTRTGAHPP